MVITHRGKTVDTQTPLLPSADTTEQHVAALFDHMLGMQTIRAQAIPLWDRAEAIKEKMRQRKHTSCQAMMRCFDLERVFGLLQHDFLIHEDDANDHWRRLSATMRRQHSLDQMFGIDAAEPSLYGAWHRTLGSQEPPPRTFSVDPIALKLVSPDMRAAYGGGRWWRN